MCDDAPVFRGYDLLTPLCFGVVVFHDAPRFRGCDV